MGIGIKKLIIISGIKDETKRFSLVDKLLSGDDITADELENKVERKAAINVDIILAEEDILISGNPLLKFTDIAEEGIKKVILKAVIRYYRKQA